MRGVILCLSVFCKIQDFVIPAPVLKNFLHTSDAVLDTVMPNNWCQVLPRCVFVRMCACVNRLLYTQDSTLTLVRLPNRTSNLKKSIPKTIITAFISDIAFVIRVCDIYNLR